MLNIPCVIFAGGKSSRMGRDKSLLPFDGFKTLTEYQLSKLQKIFTNVYISCKNKNKFDFEASFIEDVNTNSIYAPTAGFIAMFEKLQTDKIFVLSVDSPFVDKNEILKLINSDSEDYDATIAKTDSGIQPMCGIYHKSLTNKFTKMLEEDNHKLGFLLKSSNTKFVKFDDEKAFLNLNSPQEYQQALTINKL